MYSSFLLYAKFKIIEIYWNQASGHLLLSRVYFRKIKDPGIRCFIKGAPFEKFFFSVWSKCVKKNFQLGRIWTLLVLLDCPIELLTNNGVILLKWRFLFKEWFDSILSFKERQLNLCKIVFILIFNEFYLFA